MQAESGAYFGGSNNLPPSIEHSFLQNVQQFENAWKDAKQVKVYDLIENRLCKKEHELSDGELKTELKKLLDLLENKNMPLAVLGDYDSRIINKFITGELFEHETDDMQPPGMGKNFTLTALYLKLCSSNSHKSFKSSNIKYEFCANGITIHSVGLFTKDPLHACAIRQDSPSNVLGLLFKSAISVFVNVPKSPFANVLSNVAILLVLINDCFLSPFDQLGKSCTSVGSCH